MVEVFDQDEERYLKWVADHPNGYIVNVDRKLQFSQYPMVHAATHKLISSSAIGSYTTGDYIKICSASLSELEAHARTRYDRSLTRCKACLR